MEKNNIKIIVITILVIAILGMVVFMGIKVSGRNVDKNYTLETISEDDYKYFVVYSNEKYGVINTKRRNDYRK